MGLEPRTQVLAGGGGASWERTAFHPAGSVPHIHVQWGWLSLAERAACVPPFSSISQVGVQRGPQRRWRISVRVPSSHTRQNKAKAAARKRLETSPLFSFHLNSGAANAFPHIQMRGGVLEPGLSLWSWGGGRRATRAHISPRPAAWSSSRVQGSGRARSRATGQSQPPWPECGLSRRGHTRWPPLCGGLGLRRLSRVGEGVV